MVHDIMIYIYHLHLQLARPILRTMHFVDIPTRGPPVILSQPRLYRSRQPITLFKLAIRSDINHAALKSSLLIERSWTVAICR